MSAANRWLPRAGVSLILASLLVVFFNTLCGLLLYAGGLATCRAWAIRYAGARRWVEGWRHPAIWGLRIGETWFCLWFTEWQPFGEREGLTPAPFTVRLGATRRLTVARSRRGGGAA